MSECPEGPDKADGSNDYPDYADGEEALPDGDTVPARRVTLVPEDRSVAGVVGLGPVGGEAGGVQPGDTLPASRAWQQLSNFYTSLDCDLVHHPEGEGVRPEVAEVGEGVEEGHVGATHHGVTDPGEVGQQAEEHGVQGHAVEGKDDDEQDEVVAGKGSILQLHDGSEEDLEKC